jgi:hypothetical protein
MLKTLFILTLTLSTSLFAHPGHDHNSSSAPIIHSELFLLAGLGLVLLGSLIKNRFKSQKL